MFGWYDAEDIFSGEGVSLVTLRTAPTVEDPARVEAVMECRDVMPGSLEPGVVTARLELTGSMRRLDRVVVTRGDGSSLCWQRDGGYVPHWGAVMSLLNAIGILLIERELERQQASQYSTTPV